MINGNMCVYWEERNVLLQETIFLPIDRRIASLVEKIDTTGADGGQGDLKSAGLIIHDHWKGGGGASPPHDGDQY